MDNLPNIKAIHPYHVLVICVDIEMKEQLISALKEHHLKIGAIEESFGGLDALGKAVRFRPDLIFIDSQVDWTIGIEVYQQLSFHPIVVRMMGFGTERIQVPDESQYLVIDKPLDAFKVKRLMTQVDTLRKKLKELNFWGPPQNVRTKYRTRISCKLGESIHIVKVEDIHYLQSGDKYTNVYTAEKVFPIETPLKDIEFQLDPINFIRVHRGTIVNFEFAHIIKRNSEGKLEIHMKDGAIITASRKFTHVLRAL